MTTTLVAILIPLARVDAEQAAAAFFDDGELAFQSASATGGKEQATRASKNCGCSRNCLRKFDSAMLEQTLLNFQWLEKAEQDLIV